MTLTDAELDSMRATADEALPDECTITRASATAATFDPVTGTYTSGTPTTVYAGPCRLRPVGRSGRTEDQGDVLVAVERWTLTLPATVAALVVGDIVAITTSSDPHITARTFRVTTIGPGSWLIARRVTVEEVVDRW